MSRLHPLVLDPFSSHGLALGRRLTVSERIIASDREAISGRFRSSLRILEEIQAEDSVPAYHVSVALIRSRQGYHLLSRQSFQKALDLTPAPETGKSVFRCLLEFYLAISDGDVSENLGLSALAAQVWEDWLQHLGPDSYDYFTLQLETHYQELIISKQINGLSEETLISAQSRLLAVARHQCQRGLPDEAYELIALLPDMFDGVMQMAVIREILDLLRSHAAPDSLRDSIVADFTLRQARAVNDEARLRLLERSEIMFRKVGCNVGVLDVNLFKAIMDFETRQDFTANGIVKFLSRLDQFYEQYRDADSPQRQMNVLDVKAKFAEVLGDPSLTLTVARQMREMARLVGREESISNSFLLSVADVDTTDDLGTVLNSCELFWQVHGHEMSQQLEIQWLNTMFKAYRRANNYDKALEFGSQLASLLQAEDPYSETLAELNLILLKLKLQRCENLPEVAFIDALGDVTIWVKEQNDKNAAAQTVILCQRLFSFFYAKKLTEETTLHMIRRNLSALHEIPKELCTAIASTEAETWVIKGDYDKAISIVSHAMPRKTFRKNLENSRERARLQYLIGSWYIDSATRHRDMKDPEKQKRVKAGIPFLRKAAKYLKAEGNSSAQVGILYRLGAGATVCGWINEAFEQVSAAANLADKMRQLVATADPFDLYLSRVRLLDQSVNMRDIYDLLLKLCVEKRPAATWDCVQRAKARAFSEMMETSLDLGDVAFDRFLDDLNTMSAHLPYMELPIDQTMKMLSIKKLKDGLRDAPPDEREERKAELWDAMSTLQQDPILRGSLGLSSGAAASVDDLLWAFKQGEADSVVFIDWFQYYTHLAITFVRITRAGATGHAIERNDTPIPLSINSEDLLHWRGEYLNQGEMASPNAISNLRALGELIGPLGNFTQDDDLLVLSPTGAMNGIPIHALQLMCKDGQAKTLIERNPIMYTPSMSALRQCIARSKRKPSPPSTTRPATFLGAFDRLGSENDRIKAGLNEISLPFNDSAVFFGPDLTTAKFVSEISQTTDIIHFHGHQRNDGEPFSDRFLELGRDGNGNSHRISGAELARVKFPPGSAPLVTLMACSSAEQQTLIGDEPLGLLPVFLAGGASSVVGTLWSTHNESAQTFAKAFYAHLQLQTRNLDEGGDEAKYQYLDLARATQKGILAVKAEKTRRGAPVPMFCWATFVLYGSWFRRPIALEAGR
ncbi:MAG: hypothetical protein M1819_000488 [Sarea resinae]|nr:MAG: hypothetical protein M1819_000488 [Sarea resinae]